MDDNQILARIDELIDSEHELRRQLAEGKLDSAEERARLRAAEEMLDQCWDLLRQRRALRETGGDAREAAVRPPGQVEGYLS